MTDGTGFEGDGALVGEWVRRVEDLLGAGFRTARGRTDDGFSGRDFHVVVLRASPAFWDWPDPEIIEAAWATMEAELDAVAAALSRRWGAPEAVELWPYLASGLHDPRFAAAEPMNTLSQSSSRMLVWQPPDSKRFFALALGQGDKELPIELMAAVGLTSALADRPPR